MLHVQSGLPICHLQADLSKMKIVSPQGKVMFPEVFLTATQGRSAVLHSCQCDAENSDQQTSMEVIQ